MTTTRRHFLGFLAATTALTCVASQVVAKQDAARRAVGHPANGGTLGYLHFEGMTNVSSLAECNAAPGSVFVDGNNIYFNPKPNVGAPYDFGLKASWRAVA